MALRKSSLLVGRDRIHFWDDSELGFHAQAHKGETMWFAAEGTGKRVDASYRGAVDWVMDRYRLKQAGLESWDGVAALLAVADGLEWYDMTYAERDYYTDKARKAAREEALR